MSERQIFHVLYTNAPGDDGGSGFRFLQAGFKGDLDELKPIKDWLMRLEPSAGSPKGWAASSFGRVVRYAALAVVDPSFSLDESGRAGGRLAHALVVPLEEGKAVGHFGRALYERARSFFEDGLGAPSPSLNTYLEGCRLMGVVEIPEISVEDLERALRLTVVLEGLVDAAEGGRLKLSLPEISDELDLPDRILAASAALPPTLRLALRWRVGLEGAVDGFVVQPGGAGGAYAGGPHSVGKSYAEDLRQRLQQGEGAELARMINEGWEIKEWQLLPATVKAPAPVDFQGGLFLSEPMAQAYVEESDPMAKKGKASGGSSQSGNSLSTASSVPPSRQGRKSAAEYDQEYQSLREELMSYLDQRLANMGFPSPPSGLRKHPSPQEGDQPPDDGDAQWDWRGFWKKWRPEIYLALVLLLLGAMYLWPQNDRTNQGKAADEPASTAGAPSGQITSDFEPPQESELQDENVPEPPRTSVEQWAAFLAAEPARAAMWLRAVSEAQGLEQSQINLKQRENFSALAQKVKARQPLKPEENAQAATGLFEYVHARWAKDTSAEEVKDQVVTLNPDEASPNLVELARSLQIDLPSGASAWDSEVQAKIVLAWIQKNERP